MLHAEVKSTLLRQTSGCVIFCKQVWWLFHLHGYAYCSKAATPGTFEHAQALLITSSAAGQEVEVDLEKDILTDIASGKQYPLKSIGEVRRFLYLTGTQTIWESTMNLVQQAVTLL